MANLLEFSRDIMARTPEGKEALIAMRAIRDWKASPAIRKAHGNLAAYHDVLVELHAAGAIKFKGEDFMNTATKKDGADYGLEVHAKWIKAGRPGRFSDFLAEQDSGRQRAIFESNPGLKENFGTFEAYEAYLGRMKGPREPMYSSGGRPLPSRGGGR